MQAECLDLCLGHFSAWCTFGTLKSLVVLSYLLADAVLS